MDADFMSALGEAVEAARNDPERDREEIVADIAGRLDPSTGPAKQLDVDLRKRAEEALGSAKAQADDLGEHPDVASLDAMIGIGYAILAVGADAEVFFAMFAERGAGR